MHTNINACESVIGHGGGGGGGGGLYKHCKIVCTERESYLRNWSQVVP